MSDSNRQDGQTQTGSEYGSSIRDQLSRELQERTAGQDAPAAAGQPSGSILSRLMNRIRVRQSEILMFYQELALLTECGMPLLKALRTLQERWEGGAFRGVIRDLANEVEQGRSFSQALGGHPALFPPTIVAMVRAGEKSGRLPEMLGRIAQRGERLMAARRKVISSMIYPAIIVLVACVVIAFVFGVLADGFKFFTELGTKVPPSMQLLLDLGNKFRTPAFWTVVVAIIVGLGILYTILAQFRAFRYTRDWLLINTFGVGHFVRQALLVNFSTVFSTLLSSGVPIQECFQATHDTTRNEVLRDTIQRVMDAVHRGERITPELKRGGTFPRLAYDLASAGEEVGALDRVFARMASVYAEKQATELEMVGKIMQPLIVIVLALIVGFIVFAFFSTYASAFQAAPQI